MACNTFSIIMDIDVHMKEEESIFTYGEGQMVSRGMSDEESQDLVLSEDIFDDKFQENDFTEDRAEEFIKLIAYPSTTREDVLDKIIENELSQATEPDSEGDDQLNKRRLGKRMIERFKLKKLENIRQTIIRRFKKNVRKVAKHIRMKPGRETSNNIRAITKDYALNSIHRFQFMEIFGLMTSVVLSNGVAEKILKPVFTEKSCNDTYISELFRNPGFEQLFGYHLELAKLGDMYTQKFAQLKMFTLTDSDKDLITEYSLTIAD